MIIVHKLEMDLEHRGIMPRIDVVQGDVNTRVLELKLFSGGDAWNVPSDAAVWMAYCTSVGKRGVYDTLPDGTGACTVQGNILTVTLAPQMMAEAGTVLAQVELVRGSDSLATFLILVCVERNVGAEILAPEDYVNMLSWMEGELDRLLEKAKAQGDFDGPAGPRGERGISAYEYAVAAGFEGSEETFGERLNTQCLPLSGGTMTGVLDMGGQALKGLGAPQENTDAATKAYVDGRRVTGSVIFRAAAWSDTAPYTQTAGIPGVQMGDWIRLEPAYRMNLEQDLAIKSALDCISFVNGLKNQIQAFCLESRPQTDLTVYVEALR